MPQSFRQKYLPSWPVHMILKFMKHQRNMYLLWQSGGPESSWTCQNNIPIGLSMPGGVKWHLCPTCYGTILDPGHAEVRGNKTAHELTRCGSALGFIGTELVLGFSRQDLRNKISHWLGNRHWRHWQNLGNTQRQACELILGPCWCTKIRLLSFNRIQSRVVTGLLTGHNTLRWWGWRAAHCAGSVERMTKPLPTFSVGVRPWPHLGMLI
jgi:hypothetical protein